MKCGSTHAIEWNTQSCSLSIWIAQLIRLQLKFGYYQCLFPSGQETSCHAVKRNFSVTGESSKDQAETSVTGMSHMYVSLCTHVIVMCTLCNWCCESMCHMKWHPMVQMSAWLVHMLEKDCNIYIYFSPIPGKFDCNQARNFNVDDTPLGKSTWCIDCSFTAGASREII